MNEQPQRLILTGRFTQAVEYVRQLHTEYRKGTDVPYIAHLLGVASLVMGEAGGPIRVTEDMILAALLHDAAEDHGGLPRLNQIEETFGIHVARMVRALSDTLVEDPRAKEPWEKRKADYIERLRHEPEDILLISAADKLYNAKSILDDFRGIGDQVWERFHRRAEQQLWYFNELLSVFRLRLHSRIVDDLDRVVRELARLTSGVDRPESSRVQPQQS